MNKNYTKMKNKYIFEIITKNITSTKITCEQNINQYNLETTICKFKESKQKENKGFFPF